MNKVWLALGFLALITIPRFTDLGRVVTNDETIWRDRAGRYVAGIATLDPSLTFSGGQPGVTTMFLAGLADQFHSFASSQMAIALALAVLLICIVLLLLRLVPWPMALVAGALLALDPFLIAHSRLVHTDALAASLTLLSFLLMVLAWKEQSRRYLFIAAAAVTLSILTKFFTTWLILPLLFLVGSRRFGEKRWKRLGLLALTGVAVVIILWPVVLNPKEPVEIILKYSKLSAATAEYGKGADQPLYYVREWWFRITPMAALFAPVGVLGLLLSGRRGLPKFPARGILVLLLACALGYGFLLSLSEQKADRYFLFGILVTDVLTAGGLCWLMKVAGRLLPTWNWEKVNWVGGVLVVSLLAWDIAAFHPYYLVYHNPLAPAERTRKLGWGEGLEAAAAWLTSLRDSETGEVPGVATMYDFAFREHYGGLHDSLGHEYDSDAFQYVVLYRTMFERGLAHDQTQYLKAYFTRGSCEWELEANGLSHVWVFKRLPVHLRPGSEDAIQSYAELQNLPACSNRHVVADPKERWIL